LELVKLYLEKKMKRTSYLLGIVTLMVLGLAACTAVESKEIVNIVKGTNPTKPNVIAKIGNVEITEQQLEFQDKGAFFEQKSHEYDLKMATLKKVMIVQLAGADAKAAGKSIDDYIDSVVFKDKLDVSDSEVAAFAKEKNIPEDQMNDQTKTRIVDYMTTEKKTAALDSYLAKKTKNTPVVVYFDRPRTDTKLVAGDSAAWGQNDAPVTVVEFSDFQCPFCAKGAEVVNQLKKLYNGKQIQIVFKNFPLSIHQNAKATALASLCVKEQGVDKFWKFHDLVFHNQDNLDADGLRKFATESGADETQFSGCVAANKYGNQVSVDQALGESIGVKSTPSFFINGLPVLGAQPVAQFQEVINGELKHK
jgi:protein-disulfide isomerase